MYEKIIVLALMGKECEMTVQYEPRDFNEPDGDIEITSLSMEHVDELMISNIDLDTLIYPFYDEIVAAIKEQDNESIS